MTKEIPLSLQVFHSNNEYQAQRLNRTEQIRLKDLHQVLKRKEKLYMKDYSFYRQRFHSHYNRRRSDPFDNNSNSLSRNSCSSVSSRTSISSAPAKLQTSRVNSVDSALASRMYDSLGEMSSMNKFQRVQRKFSLASFTENGLLTDRGSKMSKNIDKARDILFKSRSSNLKIEQANKLVNVPNDEKDEDGNVPTNIDNETIKTIQEDEENDQSGDEIVHAQFKVNFPKEKTNTKDTEPDSDLRNEILSRQNNPSFDVILKDSPAYDSTGNGGVRTSSVTAISNFKSLTQNSNMIVKKRVTIQAGLNSEITDESAHAHLPVENESSRSNKFHPDEETSKSFSDWRSRFSRPFKRLDPLQQKIKVFLADQADFNRIFPKRFDGVPTTCALQKELANIGREKRDQDKKERKKKNDLVLEVLGKLGIEDNHILSMYQE